MHFSIARRWNGHENDGAARRWVTTGRGHSPSADRKVEAGPRAGLSPALKLPPIPSRDAWRGRGLDRGAGSDEQSLNRFGHGSSSARRRGLDDLCPPSAPHQRADDEQMTKAAQHYLETTVRIEAADIQEQYRQAACRRTDIWRPTVGLRIGRRHGGVIAATFDRDDVRLILRAADGQTQREHVLSFKEGGASRFPCVRCPQCGLFRKRLLLLREGPLVSYPDFEFVCVVCAGFEADYVRRRRSGSNAAKRFSKAS